MENYLNQITIHSEIRFGKPCIKDTRIAVSDILTWLASGMTMEEILEDYPQLNKTHIYAAQSTYFQCIGYKKNRY